MYYILLTAQQAATQAASAAQEATTQAPSNDIIGIGGIIATLLVGIVTCLVTWKLTMKSIKQLKISYNIQVFPILSKTRFFLDNLPQKKIIFECPMQNVQTQEVAYNNANTTNKITVSSKSNFILMAITALLFISMQQWSYYISEFIWFTGIHLRTNGAVAFIMSLLLLTIIINVYGVPIIDKYIKSHPKRTTFIKLTMAIVSIILLMLIIFDFIIVHPILQIITAIIVIVLLSLLIHFLFISKNTR